MKDESNAHREGENIAGFGPRRQRRTPRDPRYGFAGAFRKGPHPKTLTKPPKLTPTAKSGTLFHK